MKRFCILIASICTAMFFYLQTAYAAVTVCNKSEHDHLYIAVIYNHWHTRGEPPSWPMKGWYNIARGKCGTVVGARIERKVFLSIQYFKDGKYEHHIFKRGNIERAATNEVIGILKTFCISSEGRVVGFRDKWQEYEGKCEKHEKKEIFNAYVETGYKTNFWVYI